jgi:hypothetical protein
LGWFYPLLNALIERLQRIRVKVYVGAGAAVAADNASVIPPLPSGLQEGDLMLCLWSARGGGVPAPIPSGWKQQVWHINGGFPNPVNSMALFYKFYQVGDGNPTMGYANGDPGDTVIAQVCAFRGVDKTTPFDVTPGGKWGSSAQNIGPTNALTTGEKGKLIIVRGHKADDWTSVATLSGDDLTWAEIGEPCSSLGNHAGMVWNYAISPTGSKTVTPKTFMITGGTLNSWLAVIQSLNLQEE